jgi:hypothetical protein
MALGYVKGRASENEGTREARREGVSGKEGSRKGGMERISE